jgi:hypothetical protein
MRRESRARGRTRARPDRLWRRRGTPPAIARTRLLALAILALLALAVVAPVGHADEGAQATAEAAPTTTTTTAAGAERHSLRAAQRAAARMKREAERAARRKERQEAFRAAHLPHKEDDGGTIVKTTCSGIVVEYKGFPEVQGSPNAVIEMVLIKSPPPPLLPISFPPMEFAFTGSSATHTIPLAAPVGRSTIDIRAKWNTNGAKGGFDIHGVVECEPAPAFTLEKLQSLGGPFTTETLSGAVGQKVSYEMIATNTGNTPLTFSKLVDPRCDPGTIAGGSLAPVEPRGTVTFTCTHTLTAADATAGSYANTATVTGTPEVQEGAPVTHESNTVVVTPVSAEEKEAEKEKPPETPKPAPTSTGGVLGTSSTSGTAQKSGVLGFASATIPALRGPQGCVRARFTASIKSAGVSLVVFYLDGHQLKRLTSKSSHKGLLSVSIDAAKLKVGAHRVTAKITMKAVSATAKATRATRALTIVRCKSAVLTPRFTG